MAGDDILNPGQIELTNRLAILSVAREADWRLQRHCVESTAYFADDYSGPPSGRTDGESVKNSPVALYQISPRQSPSYRTSFIRVTNVVGGEDYQIEVAQVAELDRHFAFYTASNSDSEKDVLEGIRDQINSHPNISNIVTADLHDRNEDGTQGTVRVQGDSPPNYKITEFASNSAEMGLVKDAKYALIRPWIYPRETGPEMHQPDRWTPLREFEFQVDHRGEFGVLPVNAADRIYMQVLRLDDSQQDKVDSFVGPSKLE